MRRFLLTSFLIASPAAACPICNTDTGQEVRAGIFNTDFPHTTAALLLPFPILAGVVLAIHFLPPRKTAR